MTSWERGRAVPILRVADDSPGTGKALRQIARYASSRLDPVSSP